MKSIDEIFNMREDSRVEFKKAENGFPKSFWETYSAFANTDGGIVVFGFDEKNNKVTGVADPYRLRDELFNTVNNPGKVSANVISNDSVKIDIYNGLNVLIVEIPEAHYSLKPVYLNANPREAYERLGEGDRKLSDEKYKSLIVGSQKETDNYLLEKYDIDDLNLDSLLKYRNELYLRTGNEKYKNIDFTDMLIEIGAMRRDRHGNGKYLLTVGGLLFFGKYNSITDRFPGFQLDYFEKESSLSTIWLDRVSSGDGEYSDINVYEFFKIVLDKLNLTIKDEFSLEEGSKTRVPYKSDLLTSLREALVNSLMHAYYDSNKPIVITAYPDYYEFKNPGKMRITVDEFVHGGTSDIRNHTMSSIMRRVGISEKAGSGGPRIFDISEKYNLKIPEVMRNQYDTFLRIWKVDLKKCVEEKYDGDKRNIILYLIDNMFISKRDAQSELCIDSYHFRVAINSLLEDKVVEFVGKGRSTVYTLKMNTTEYAYSMKGLLRQTEDFMINNHKKS